MSAPTEETTMGHALSRALGKTEAPLAVVGVEKLTTRKAVKLAIAGKRQVWCRLAGTTQAKVLDVRDVGGHIEVRTSHGWHAPLAVWREVEK